MTLDPQSELAGRQTSRPATINFSSFRLDLVGGRLLGADKVIPLRPKTWAVLVYLAERPGVLVANDTLLDVVWAGTAVTPGTLNKSIGELRAALGDDSREPRFIQTVHRRGFRFIAEVRASSTGTAISRRSQELETDERRPGTAVFVGRTDELSQLQRMFAKAQGGERQIAFVTGPAGIGKTSLIDAFLDSDVVREAAGPVWIGRAGCAEHNGPREAYMPVLDALQELTRREGGQRLLQLLRQTAPTWLAQMPWLADTTDKEDLRRSLQAVRPERMLREFVTLLETLTSDITVVLVLDDLHWSDPSTVDLIAELGHRRQAARVLLIGSYRPAELAVGEHILANVVRSLEIHRHCVELPLSDLSEDDVQNYLAARFPGSDFPRSLASRIHIHTGGDPLFMVASVDHMRTRGWILYTDPGWANSTAPEMMDLGVPDDVRRMVEGQLEDLNPPERDLLEAASVAGQQVAVPLLAAGLGCEVGEAELRCENLARTCRFLCIAGTTEWPDGSVTRRYAFTHELHRRVVYEDIPDGRCAQLHLRIGKAIEEAYGSRSVDIAAQLAFHFERSRDRERALQYLVAAGVHARRRFTNREALAYLEAALALARSLPRNEERKRRELEIRLTLGPALGDIHGFTAQPVRENYERAAELCAALGIPEQRFEVLYALWYLHSVSADREETLALAAQLDDLAQQLGTPGHGLLADSVLLRSAVYDGRFADARNHMESIRARQRQHDRIDLPLSYGVDPLITAIMHYGFALWFLGETQLAEAAELEGIALARESGNPFFLSAALIQGAIIESFSKNVAGVVKLAEEAEKLASEQGYVFWRVLAKGLIGWAWVQQGRVTEGSLKIEEALAATRSSGARFFWAFLRAASADSCLRAGAIDGGLVAAEDALLWSQTKLDRGLEPEIWRLKGELHLKQSNGEGRRLKPRRNGAAASNSAEKQAETSFERAIATAVAMQSKSLELRAATSLARLWAKQEREDDARKLLGRVCSSFDARTAGVDMAEARALLGELGRAAGRSPG